MSFDPSTPSGGPPDDSGAPGPEAARSLAPVIAALAVVIIGLVAFIFIRGNAGSSPVSSPTVTVTASAPTSATSTSPSPTATATAGASPTPTSTPTLALGLARPLQYTPLDVDADDYGTVLTDTYRVFGDATSWSTFVTAHGGSPRPLRGVNWNNELVIAVFAATIATTNATMMLPVSRNDSTTTMAASTAARPS